MFDFRASSLRLFVSAIFSVSGLFQTQRESLLVVFVVRIRLLRFVIGGFAEERSLEAFCAIGVDRHQGRVSLDTRKGLIVKDRDRCRSTPEVVCRSTPNHVVSIDTELGCRSTQSEEIVWFVKACV
ncbi:hypothetical protein AtEden1_Chr3g0197391 [Arabidopsis thaliana]